MSGPVLEEIASSKNLLKAMPATASRAVCSSGRVAAHNVEAEVASETSGSSSQSLIPNSQFRRPGHDDPLSSHHGFTNVLPVTFGGESNIYPLHKKPSVKAVKYYAHQR